MRPLLLTLHWIDPPGSYDGAFWGSRARMRGVLPVGSAFVASGKGLDVSSPEWGDHPLYVGIMGVRN
jgi:hypothetical protein